MLQYMYILGMLVLLVYYRVSSVAMDTLPLVFVYIVYIDGLNPLLIISYISLILSLLYDSCLR